ncbi:GAF domain-containing sensor histidine kinase [Zunongwangia sp.]|uniref:GAF domain-containing sensor histidine kinase n=1 Tax=Zunongwangia sp. TaxID=1965325 RepID=UPI003AA7DE17
MKISKESLEAEFKRIEAVAEFAIDYSSSDQYFQNITNLASMITGAQISLVNILDSYWQWSIAAKGLPVGVMKREQSICQYTIHHESYEVKNFREDDKYDVPLEEAIHYYFGVPLITDNGESIGALCVLDEVEHEMSTGDKELLKILAKEIVEKLELLKKNAKINSSFHKLLSSQRELAYDLRGPATNILGLSKLSEDEKEVENLKNYLQLCGQTSSEMLDLLSVILNKQENNLFYKSKGKTSLVILKEKLLNLFSVQAKAEQVDLDILLIPGNNEIKFFNRYVFQIVGNIISYSIRSSPKKSKVNVFLSLKNSEVSDQVYLIVEVKDIGEALPEENISAILESELTQVSIDTISRQGFGLGLKLVNHLVKKVKGGFTITSEKNNGNFYSLKLTCDL